MKNGSRFSSAAFLCISLAMTGCLKPGEESTGARPESSAILDADHGGARIALPEIDPAALGKTGADTTIPNPPTTAWFELTITGENMQGSSYKFPLSKGGGTTFEIKGIPAGKNRSFHGWLVNGKGIVTHEGITVADIQGGVFADIRLFLAKATGSAEVCVVIEGQKPPPCAAKDTLPPPPPDTAAIGGCWQLSSPWISGKVKLYDSVVNGTMGKFEPDSGSDLPFTNWTRRGDSLLAILISPDQSEKWLLSGKVQGNNESWMGIITRFASSKSAPFGAKSLPCAMVPDSGKAPMDTTPPPPKPGTGSIPMPGTGAKETTLCFQMRFDYADSACEIQGYAKMDFLDGKIMFGNITVADMPAREYSNIIGSYDPANIKFYGITQTPAVMSRDTLSLTGAIAAGATMAKGGYIRLPSEQKGIWTMSLVECGSWIPKYPDPTCPAVK